jgi:N-acetylneuraminic acid mutarotase
MPQSNKRLHVFSHSYRLSIGLILLVPSLCLAVPQAALAGSWTLTAPLATPRWAHTATLLSNGKVLVVGGTSTGNNFLGSAELYDPATRSWTAATPLSVPRQLHTATLLDNGKVLVAGGIGSTGYLTSAELYNPGTNSWTPAGNLIKGRRSHTATLFAGGKVLVVAGYGTVTGTGYEASPYLKSTDLYDPDLNSWPAVSLPLITGKRISHTATRLTNGKVLVAGGWGPWPPPEYPSITALNTAELCDPDTYVWTATGSLNVARNTHTATLLPSGKVLVAGGFGASSVLASTELYDPANPATWTLSGSAQELQEARGAHTATLLLNGKVLAAGGYNAFTTPDYLNSAELYDPAAGTWTSTGSMQEGRRSHTATILNNGKVLVVGGYGASGANSPLASVEIYNPQSGHIGGIDLLLLSD